MITEIMMEEIIKKVITREGGFVNDPFDPGGATNWGITRKTLSEWLSDLHAEPTEASVDDVKNLTPEGAARIYLEKYIKTIGLDAIQDPKLFELIVDCGVNHGTSRAIRWLQTSLGVDSDGVIGRETKMALAALAMHPERAEKIFKEILSTRIKFYVNIVVGKPTQIKFLRGWINRALEFLEA